MQTPSGNDSPCDCGFRGPFEAGKKKGGLDWVKGLHDLRHFRPTQWLREGIDVRTVPALLGHGAIQTTRRYLHVVDPTFVRVREIQAREPMGDHWETEAHSGTWGRMP